MPDSARTVSIPNGTLFRSYARRTTDRIWRDSLSGCILSTCKLANVACCLRFGWIDRTGERETAAIRHYRFWGKENAQGPVAVFVTSIWCNGRLKEDAAPKEFVCRTCSQRWGGLAVSERCPDTPDALYVSGAIGVRTAPKLSVIAFYTRRPGPEAKARRRATRHLPSKSPHPPYLQSLRGASNHDCHAAWVIRS